MAQKSVKLRLIFGGLMILILIGLFSVEIGYFNSISKLAEAGVSLSAGQKLLGNGPVVAVLAGLMSFVGAWEVTVLARQNGAKPFVALTMVGALVLAVEPYFRPFLLGLGQAGIIALFLVLAIVGQMLRRETQGAGANLAWSMLGILYLGLFISFLVDTRVQFGPGPIILLICAAKGSDIGAYLTGINFGKHKLIPWLSPGKTVEGLAGAIIFSAIITFLLVKAPIIFHRSVLASIFQVFAKTSRLAGASSSYFLTAFKSV